MDLATVGGLLIAIAAVVVAELMDHSSLLALYSPSALLLIIGGTLGSTAISFTLTDLLALPQVIWSTLRGRTDDPVALVRKIVGVAEKARREGLLALEDEAQTVAHPILRRGLVLVADGVDPAEVQAALASQSELLEQAVHRSAGVLESAGAFAPTIGIIGTVMGLVRVLSNLDDQGKLAGSIAVAFLATFYGIATANLLWLPLAAKVKRNAQVDALLNDLVMEGLAAVQGGWVPRMVQEKLSVFLTPRQLALLQATSPGGDHK